MAMVLFSSIATFACAYFAFTSVETAGFAALSILPAVIYFRQRWYCSRCELEFTAPSNAQNRPKGVKDTAI